MTTTDTVVASINSLLHRERLPDMPTGALVDFVRFPNGCGLLFGYMSAPKVHMTLLEPSTLALYGTQVVVPQATAKKALAMAKEAGAF